MTEPINQQLHGYRNGHQLLSASAKLSREDQDAVDRLSDMAGPLRPGETFNPYLTSYPLPSGTHYVIARTWQDLSAPRAGCVLTRSLLVPMPFWQHVENLAEFLALLSPLEPGERASPLELKPVSLALPIVEDSRTIELVEALFLETRQPIVFFDSAEAENITVRLLSALWPSLKRGFAACTFALAPRKIEGRDFDLLFAPKSARARFNEWSGRRIDVDNSKTPRHRWSAATSAQVFKSERPSFIANDALGLLKDESRGDESALRLSLLWNELAAKAETTPTAVLGLVDILNSLQGSAPEQVDKLQPLLERAIWRVTRESSTQQAWRFVSTLAGKLENRIPGTNVREMINLAAESLAERDPEAALTFLGAESNEARTVPAIVMAGLGHGISGNVERLRSVLAQLPPHVGTRLLALSSAFLRDILLAASQHPSQWVSLLEGMLLSAGREERRGLRRQLAPRLDNAVFAPLVPPLLDGASANELVEFTLQIGESTGFEIPEFDEPLGNTARDEESLRMLRNAVVTKFDGVGANRFLLSTLRVDTRDIAWIGAEMPPDRARRLLVQLLEGASDRSLLSVLRNPITREQIMEILAGDLALGATQIARALSLGDLRVDRFMDMGLSALPNLNPPQRDALQHHLLARALGEADTDDPRVAMLVAEAGSRTDAYQLVRLATSEGAAASRVGKNVVIFESSPSEVREQIVKHIDELSERLVRRETANLGQAAYEAWAKMIASARDPDVRLRAASSTLAYALRLKTFPVSSLIVVAFPVVHKQLLISKEGDEVNIPAFLLLPMSFFVDWDRAGSARKELVDAFVRSNWPPADLLVTAMEADIEKFVFDRLSRTSSGCTYLKYIEEDISRLDARQRKRARESLEHFLA
jgi:hypothetical protein